LDTEIFENRSFRCTRHYVGEAGKGLLEVLVVVSKMPPNVRKPASRASK